MSTVGYCKWTVRPGNNNSFWAMTPCKHGYNPLTKINKLSQIEDTYNGRLCPICGRTIQIDLEWFMNDSLFESNRKAIL